MTEVTKISCCINTTDASVPLGIEITLNGQTVFAKDHVTGLENVEFLVDDTPAEHQLIFELKNKLPQHTVLDDAGKIIQDATISVSNLAFDEIVLNQLFFNLTDYYHNFNGTADPVKDRFYGEMGCNGQLILKFSTPIYLWLLENM
jgi:hypothetical protein